MRTRNIGRAELRPATRAISATRFFEGEGEGEGEGAAIDASNPEVKALIDEAVANATKGLTRNRDEVLSEKKELQKQLSQMQEQWEGLDPKMVKSLVDRFKNDEEAKLISEGKIDDVIDRRVSAMQQDYESKLKAANERLAELEDGVTSKDDKIKDLVIEGNIRQAAAQLNLHPTAFDDAIYRAKGRFALDEDGNPIARDEQGTLLMGRNGKDPLSVAEWLEGMKEKAPHWFPSPQGAGAGGGGRGGRGGSFVISREDARNPQQYQAAKEAAAKAGQSLQIADE